MTIKIEIRAEIITKSLSYHIKKVIDNIAAESELLSIKRKILDPDTNECVGIVNVEY
jgi:hypothetical protein